MPVRVRPPVPEYSAPEFSGAFFYALCQIELIIQNVSVIMKSECFFINKIIRSSAKDRQNSRGILLQEKILTVETSSIENILRLK
ncbi:MAG: hypothetical protein ACOYB8_10585, partial [Eubacteriaceae bacterium]